MFLLSAPVWAEPARQMCLSCHPTHYAERGRCNGCHRGNQSSDRKNIAHTGLVVGKYARHTLCDPSYLKRADSLLDQYACRRCHISNGRGNRLAVNLDASATRKTPAQLDNSIRRPVDNMPDFSLNDEQAVVLINAILAGYPSHRSSINTPSAVHFGNKKNKNVDVFTRTCGFCHRLLSERLGALGTGNIGPNLSGLLSVYYPKNFRVDDSWTQLNLLSWLKNPREIKPWARMRPIKITADELKELEVVLEVASEAKN
jgi:hypothetical protein